MSSLSVIVLTYNESANILACLESIKWADEIIIVDSFSSDETLEICQKYTAKIFKRKVDDFASQRNFGKEKASKNWVLFADADERVTPELKEEILNKVNSNEGFDGYFIPRKNLMIGKWINSCGFENNRLIRLFKKEKGEFTGIVHETVQLKGEAGILKNHLIHYSSNSIAEFMSKINFYTSYEAQVLFQRNRPFKWYKLVYHPTADFLRRYIRHRGYKDGIHGLTLCALMGMYSFLSYAKLGELYRQKHANFIKLQERGKDL